MFYKFIVKSFLACVRVKGGESKQFKVDIEVRCNEEGVVDKDGKEGGEWRLPGPLYADDLVLCGKLEEDLRVMVRQYFEVYRRIGQSQGS